MEGKSYKLLGIIESSYYEDDIYIIQLIPSYIIINWIIKDELANTVYNLYVDIDDNNMINNMCYPYNNLKVGDVILSINKCPLNTFNMIKDDKLGFDIPLMLYIYYNCRPLATLEIMCLRNNGVIIINQELASIDLCMKIPYNNINHYYDIHLKQKYLENHFLIVL